MIRPQWVRRIFAVLTLIAAVGFAGARSMEGVVMATSPGSLFVMAQSGDHVEVAVPSSARILRNGDKAGLEDLQPQDQVVVRLTEDGKSATDIVARTPY